MITRDTAARIAYAYDEIKAAKKLLSVIEEGAKRGDLPDFRDSFGPHYRGLQLGPPCIASKAVEGFANALRN